MLTFGSPVRPKFDIDPGPDPSDLPAAYLDNNHWQISEKVAKTLCGGRLPGVGYEKIIEYKGYVCYVLRTVTSLSDDRRTFVPARSVWAIHVTNRRV